MHTCPPLLCVSFISDMILTSFKKERIKYPYFLEYHSKVSIKVVSERWMFSVQRTSFDYGHGSVLNSEQKTGLAQTSLSSLYTFIISILTVSIDYHKDKCTVESRVYASDTIT
jgi:hypothetical protein